MKQLKDLLLNENINEAKIQKPANLQKMIIAAMSAMGTEFDVDINVGNIKLENEFIEKVLQNSIGHIIENVVAAGLTSTFGTANVKHITPKEKLVGGENNACDVILTTEEGKHNVEIKAYKTLSNIKPTAGQWNADYILCVKYALSGKTVSILELNCVEPGQNPDKHTKITREMINNGITVKN